ncbi:MAG: hypothetical protein ACKE51_08715, partial [Methylococcaceae bacterium]
MSSLAARQKLAQHGLHAIRAKITSAYQNIQNHQNNFSTEQFRAVKLLKNDPSIVILPADKGRTTVVMDKVDYTDRLESMLSDSSTYVQVKKDPTPRLQKALNSKLKELFDYNVINKRLYFKLRSSTA